MRRVGVLTALAGEAGWTEGQNFRFEFRQAQSGNKSSKISFANPDRFRSVDQPPSGSCR
jgi:hypothetical protein